MKPVLTLKQGIDGGFAWKMIDGSSPANLAGYTAKAQVRSKDASDGTLLFEFTATASADTVSIQWTAEQSLLWQFEQGYFDVLLYWPDGRPRQIVAQGQVRVDKVVTHG